MKIGVFSNFWSPDQGGGVSNIISFARALLEVGPVDLHIKSYTSIEELKGLYGVDLQGVRIVNGMDPRRPSYREHKFNSLLQIAADARYDLIIRQSGSIPYPTTCKRAVLVTEFPTQSHVRWREKQYLKTYSRIVAISQFTSAWIARRWGVTSTIIQPAIQQGPVLPKVPIIVAVGRFSGSRRGKHQLEMVEAYRQLLSEGVAGWELHLCGAAADREYEARVREAANGLPVFLHTNLSRAQLDKIVGAASIFWHATGVDFDEEAHPELMEHFGMSTAEAMSAGCIPVVIGKGGQVEVAGRELHEWTWQDWAECISKTKYLIDHPDLRRKLAETARRQASAFSSEQFQAKVCNLAGQLLDRQSGHTPS